ncbi:DJ-1/PfpI family protein [Verrucomicrobium spinosum]|uniref:DJ-1/PfpI family protein n=1 Tax=Verrucomicrobium spinosum TaxID=2736 RepID=UPI0009467CCC|nr:DJ-1/PfpI family protein [Verrucomicrobium spinosum]
MGSYTINADVTFAEIKAEEYAGIFFSGGRAPEYIREDQDLLKVTKYFFEKNLPSQASAMRGDTCPGRLRSGATHGHGTQVQFDLEVCGGIFVNEACVVDGNLVSGRTFHDHGHYMGAWMKLLDEERNRRQATT